MMGQNGGTRGADPVAQKVQLSGAINTFCWVDAELCITKDCKELL
jgi:hypothetical protein